MTISQQTKILSVSILLMGILTVAHAVDGGAEWRQALPGFAYQFPRDHAAHPDYKTEWWYFTGNLQDEKGHAFGYELTFFRQGALPPERRAELVSNDPQGLGRFVQNDFKFAHFAITDLSGKKFYFTQKISRGAFGEAGFGQMKDGKLEEPLARMERWSLVPQADGAWQITAKIGGETPMSIDLRVMPSKPPVIEGTDGVSQKAEGLGNASHYYSFTRLQTSGALTLGKDAPSRSVRGESWFDHEWASNQMVADQVGWDWFCFQFDDGTEMMLYAMRRKDGSVDPVSGGTWVETDGRTEHLRREDFRLQGQRTWKSAQTGATYPLEWRVELPSKQLAVTVKPRLDNQELVLPGISYWEGAIAIDGQEGGRKIGGVGYMELTGYAQALQGLQGESAAANGASRPPR